MLYINQRQVSVLDDKTLIDNGVDLFNKKIATNINFGQDCSHAVACVKDELES